MDDIYEAVVESDGRIRLRSSVHLEKGQKVFVSIPGERCDSAVSGLALSEPSLASEWLNQEEDEAWAHLQ